MASLNTFLNSINLAGQALQASMSGIEEIQAGDHLAGATQLIQVAGATAAAATNDSEIQAEATAATALAINMLPIISGFLSLFKKQKSVAVAASPNAAVAAMPVANSSGIIEGQ
jgi:hypothetical protein